jgi:hypothetical protein
MVEVRVLVPEEHVGALYEFVAGLCAADPDPLPPRARPPWTEKLAKDAINSIVATLEYPLTRRMAEARGQRVSVSELAADFGLPGAPSVSDDFPGLSAWCSTGRLRPGMPVRSSGEGSDGWYYMPIEVADKFLSAFAAVEA